MSHHLAQVNVAEMRAPVDDPLLADFVALLEPLNELADESPGFIWRLQTEEGDATSVSLLDDDRLLVNLSVWESPDALADYAYRSVHTEALRRRGEWFSRMTIAHLALWWVPAGHLPVVTEAEERLTHLRKHGPTAHAFTLRRRFPRPDG